MAKIKIKFRVTPTWWLVAFYLFFTFMLRPWRGSVAQDDGVYVDAALAVLRGDFTPHPLTLAAAWPQTLLGAGGLAWFPEAGLSVLNLLTWLFFGASLLFASRLVRLPIAVILSFFAFPIWIQYGASFLTDIYAVYLLFLTLWILEHQKEGKPLRLGEVWVALAVVFLVLQRQNLALLPFLWGAFGLYRAKKANRTDITLIAASLAGLLLYALLPQGLFQKSFLQWRLYELELHGANLVAMFARFLQFVLSIGIFFLPLLDLGRLSRGLIVRVLVAQILLAAFFAASESSNLAAGVLFIDYLPPFVGSLFFTFGLWGWIPLWRWISKARRKDPILEGTLYGGPALIFLSVFMGSLDMRYVLVLTVPLLVRFTSEKGAKFLGARVWYFAPVALVALITNLYNLDTVDIRWAAAREIEEQGAEKIFISAGYGRDLFEFGRSCTEAAVGRLKRDEDREAATPLAAYHHRIYLTAPRVFEDEWKPQFIIKPSLFFGKPIALKGVDESLQAAKEYEYTIFGIPSRVTVYEREDFENPWCFRAPEAASSTVEDGS